MKKEKRYKSKKNTKKRRLIDVIFLIGMLVGLLLIVYPFFSDGLNNYMNQKSIQRYQDKSLKENQKSYEQAKKEMVIANKKLAKKGLAPAKDPFSRKVKEEANKSSKSFYEKKTIGIIYIPKIKVSLPIFKGTEERFLQRGAGLLEGTSFPTGGKNTHAVITAHRGLPKAKLFTNLPKLEKGDLFYIEIDGERLAYEVFGTEVVEPTDTSRLTIKKDEDIVTLLTCTPYMVNSHRLLVTGKRIPLNEKTADEQIGKTNRWNQKVLFLWIIVSLFIAFLILALLFKSRKRRKIRT